MADPEHLALLKQGICAWNGWRAKDIQGGKKLHEQVERAIQVHDRLLLVLSESSIHSEWVSTEIRNTLKVEKKDGRRKLFPIRLC